MLTRLAEIATILTLILSGYGFLESTNRLPEQLRLPAAIQPATYFYVIAFLLALAFLGGTLGASQNAARFEEAARNPKPDPNLSEVAKVVVDLLNATKAAPQQIAEPYTTFSKAQAEVINKLGLLRHTGWKRYLEWIANYPDAAANAERWRVEVNEILRANYGQAVASRFNTPTTRESERTGWLIRQQEHAFRVDRLGEILDDILKGKIPAGLGIAQ